MRTIRAIAIIVVILLGSFVTSRITDPEEVLPVLPPWDIEAVSDPPIGNLAWPPGEPVLGVEMGGESRAYLLSLLEWHGVLNDRISGQDIAITYSTLSDSGAAYNRTVDDRLLTFAVHEGVYRNNLVLRDKETGSLWSQMEGKALMGPLQGRTLNRIAATRTSWSEWETLHPSTQVLLPPGDRDYGIHMFGDYKTNNAILFPYRYEDPSLKAKDLVLGIRGDRYSIAFPISTLSVERVAVHDIGSESVLVTYVRGTSIAFDPGNRSFSFVSESTMVDELGNRWNMTTGRRESDGHALRSLQANATVCYWFAWLNFNPETILHGIESRGVAERSWAVATLPWTLGLLICLIVLLVNRHLQGKPQPIPPSLKWIAFRRSILTSVVAILVSGILLIDSPRNLQMGNVIRQALFGFLFLVFGLAMAYEWYNLRGYEGARLPIDVGDFRDNLARLFATGEVETMDLGPKRVAWIDAEGGYAVSESSVEFLFHDKWLYLGCPGGVLGRDMEKLKGIAEEALITPMEELA